MGKKLFLVENNSFKRSSGMEVVAQQVSICCKMHWLPPPCPLTRKYGEEPGKSEVQDHLELFSELEVTLRYEIPYLRMLGDGQGGKKRGERRGGARKSHRNKRLW